MPTRHPKKTFFEGQPKAVDGIYDGIFATANLKKPLVARL
jgi:hypothetical protein